MSNDTSISISNHTKVWTAKIPEFNFTAEVSIRNLTASCYVSYIARALKQLSALLAITCAINTTRSYKLHLIQFEYGVAVRNYPKRPLDFV